MPVKGGIPQPTVTGGAGRFFGPEVQLKEVVRLIDGRPSGSYFRLGPDGTPIDTTPDSPRSDVDKYQGPLDKTNVVFLADAIYTGKTRLTEVSTRNQGSRHIVFKTVTTWLDGQMNEQKRIGLYYGQQNQVCSIPWVDGSIVPKEIHAQEIVRAH